MAYKIIALDESGKASLKHSSPFFVLSGAVVSSDYLSKLDSGMRRLKKRFFNDEEIVFHCRDILRKKGVFSVLQDEKIDRQFWADYISYLNPSQISVAVIIADKSKAKTLGWNDVAILRYSYRKILEEFTKKHLIGTHKGKIVAESDPYQDKYLLEAHNRLQTMGVPSEGITGFDYRNCVTSVSLVNKANLDNCVQIADSFAIMAHIFYEVKINKKNQLSDTEKALKRLIDRKMSSKVNPGIFEILV